MEKGKHTAKISFRGNSYLVNHARSVCDWCLSYFKVSYYELRES